MLSIKRMVCLALMALLNWAGASLAQNRNAAVLTNSNGGGAQSSTGYRNYGIVGQQVAGFRSGSTVASTDGYIGTAVSIPASPTTNTLVVSSENAIPGGQVTFKINIANNSSPLEAFGFRLNFNNCNNYLTYASVQKGDLTQSFQNVDGNAGSGYVGIGGFGTTPIPANSNGSIAKVTFNVSASCPVGYTCTLTLSNLVDGVSTYTAQSGTFMAQGCALNGDVNNDSQVTPADALCAFKMYLGNPQASCTKQDCADCNKDGNVTPADALGIFKTYLGTGSCSSGQAAVSSTERLVVQYGAGEIQGTRVVVPIQVSDPSRLRAFGFDFTYPADVVRFSNIERSEVSQVLTELSGYEFRPGNARVGGFAGDAEILTTRPSTMLYLHFDIVNPAALSQFDIKLNHLLDDLDGAEVQANDSNPLILLQQISLNQNIPNPFNPRTAIQFSINDNRQLPTRVGVYDLSGRLVDVLFDEVAGNGHFVVYWEGKKDDRSVASGLYMYELQRENYPSITKKMMLMK